MDSALQAIKSALGQGVSSSKDKIKSALMALKGESDIIRPVPTPAPFVETSPGRFINPRVLERNAPTPTAMPTPKVMGVSDQQPMKAGNRQDKESLVRQGFSQWSNVPENELESKLPVTKYIPEMIAISEEYGIPDMAII